MFDPFSEKTSGYHVLLEPRGEERELLSNTIGDIAVEYGGPVFAPHVTLLAQIPDADEEVLMRKTAELASTLTPISLTLEGFGIEEKYFRSLYMYVRDTEEVGAYHAKALEHFGMPASSSYLPHLSLLYGNYAQEKKGVSAHALHKLNGTTFLADALYLYRTPGEVATWECIGEFPLLGK